jgi:hypothetical protein
MSKEKFVLFNVNNNEGKDESILQLDSTIPQVQLNPSIMRDHNVDIDRMASEILEKAEQEGRKPILNIQVRSSEMPPLIDEDKLSVLNALGIKVVFSFEHYDSKNSGGRWSSILKDADHVFFAKDKDREGAVSQKHVSRLKAFHVSSFTTLIESEILSRKPNIFMSEGLEDAQRIREVVEAAKEFPGTKVIMAVDTTSQQSVNNAIAARFGIDNADQLIGIKLEVDDILRDKVHGPKKLEAYISQLTKQFQDNGKEINPVEIYCDFSNPKTLQDLYKQAKYTILPQGSKEQNFSSGCIPLQGASTKESIVSELSARERANTLNKFSISKMKEVLVEIKEKIINILRSIIAGPKEASKIAEPVRSAPKIAQPVHSQSNSIKQPDYLYEDRDIEALLKLSLNQDKILIQPVLSLAPSYREILSGTMLETIMSIEGGGKDAAVMPLETGGKHWVCLAVTKDEDGKMVFTYNDPIGTPISARQDLVKMIGEMAPHAKIVDLHTKQQQNNVDCGPFVVDNLVKMATGQPILDTQQSQNAGARLRAEHSLAISANQSSEHAASIKQSIVRGGTVVSPSTSRITSSNSSVGRGR